LQNEVVIPAAEVVAPKREALAKPMETKKTTTKKRIMVVKKGSAPPPKQIEATPKVEKEPEKEDEEENEGGGLGLLGGYGSGDSD